MQHQPWIDSLGRRAGEVYYDRLGHRRVVTPPKFHADDGTVRTGHEAIRASCAHFDDGQAKRREALRRLSPNGRRAYATYLLSLIHI